MAEAEVDAFLKEYEQQSVVVRNTTDPALWKEYKDKFWAPGAQMVRPSGNLITVDGLEKMLCSGDVKFPNPAEAYVDKGHEHVKILAGGNAAVVVLTEHIKFEYKGKPNDDTIKNSVVLEKTDGAWKIAHIHRCSSEAQ